MTATAFVDVLDYCPGDRNAVIRRRAPAQFVEKHEAAARQVVHDVGCFAHLDHERTLAHRDIVARADTGEDFVDHTDTGALGRDERTHLGQERDERRLTQQGTFSRHVRTCDNDDLLALTVEEDVVGHIGLTGWHERLDDRMTALTDVDDQRVVHHGADVTPFFGQYGKGV